jgi:hypothetical protein
MRLKAAFLAALSIVFALPAAAQVSVTPVPHDYQINGWQVRCWGSGTALGECTARKSFGQVEATIDVGDNYLRFEVMTPCATGPDVYRTRSWDRRQEIAVIDPARALAASLEEGLQACRRRAPPDRWAEDTSSLIFLLLQAVEIPAYVTMGIGVRQ